MKTKLRALLAMLFLFAVAAGAVAEDRIVVGLLPDGGVVAPNELDTIWPDSIVYYNPAESPLLWTGTNYWSGTRFTAPSDFTLQGIRFMVYNQNGTTDPCEVWVYQDLGNLPFMPLHDHAVYDSPVPAFSGLSTSWLEIAFADTEYIDFSAGDDFWIIYGPAPGGANGWYNLYDSSPSDRSRISNNGIGGTYSVQPGGDFYIIAEGEAQPYYDLVVNSITNDLERFFLPENYQVNLSTRVTNNGNIASPATTATFSVTDSEGNELFNEVVDLDPINPGLERTVTTDSSFSAADPGRYIVSVVVGGDDDPNLTNNSYLLHQQVVAEEDWYAYDDGSFESAISTQTGGGWAVTFYPTGYPARVDSINVFFPLANGDVDLRLLLLGESSYSFLWQYNGPVSQGWNTLPVNDVDNPNGFSFSDGQVGVMIVIDANDPAMVHDTDPPNSANNPDMPTVGWSVSNSGDNLGGDTNGNWGMRVHMAAAAPPSITFRSTELDFGDVQVNTTGSAWLVVENSGSGPAIIDSVFIPITMQDVIALADDLPFIVNSYSTDSLEVQWTPDEEGTLFSGMLVFHNDVQMASPVAIRLAGTAVTTSVRTLPAEGLPAEYFLGQNAPNPFNPVTGIRFGLKEAGFVRLTVYDLLGRRVARLVDGELEAGVHVANFDGHALASGVYLYELEVNGFRSVRKMALLK